MEIKLLGGLDGHKRKGGGFQTGYQVFDPCGLCPTLLADGGGYGIMIAEIKVIGRMDHTLDNTHESANRIYSQYGLCPTIPTCAGGNIQPKILEGEENLSERQNGIKAKKLPNGNIRFYQDDEKKSAISELQVQSGEDVGQTITTANISKIYEEKQIVAMRGRNPENHYRIRKLTPRECWRLMGFSDEDFEKAEKVNSNTQLYKQAGNSIVVKVLEAIFLQLL